MPMPTGRHLSSVVIVATLALVATYLTVPVEAVQALIWIVTGCATTAGILLAVRHNRPADPVPWWLLAAGTWW